jgi:hypothetical protein
VQKVIFCLEEIRLPYVREDYGRQFGNTSTGEYRKLNPNAKVPTLIDGDLVIWESHTILRYLAAVHAPALTGATSVRRLLTWSAGKRNWIRVRRLRWQPEQSRARRRKRLGLAPCKRYYCLAITELCRVGKRAWGGCRADARRCARLCLPFCNYSSLLRTCLAVECRQERKRLPARQRGPIAGKLGKLRLPHEHRQRGQPHEAHEGGSREHLLRVYGTPLHDRLPLLAGKPASP